MWDSVGSAKPSPLVLSALVAGNEREGLKPEALQWLDRVVEIPVYGLPYSYNVATAVSMALYEYCRQYS